MRRLYYLASDLDTTQAVSRALNEEGIREWHFHVLAKDEAGLYRHQIHAATPYQQLDVLHTGPRWALLAALVALGLGLLAWSLQPLPWHTSGLDVVLITLVGGFFGAWLGGMVGLSRENYKIAPFHDAIESGRYLLMIDVGNGNRSQVRELMNMRFPEVEAAGSDSVLINPLSAAHQVYHQTTH